MKSVYFPMIVMLLLMVGAHTYVFYRIWQLIPACGALRILLLIIGILIAASPFVAMSVGGMLPGAISGLLYKVGTSWMIIFLYLLIAVLLLDLIRVTNLLPLDSYMRSSWIGLGALTAVITLIMTGGYLHYLNKARVELTLPVAKEMPGGGEGLKIVAISDMHLGYGIGRKEFEGWVELINKEDPDVLLIPGDIIDNNVVPLEEQRMEEVFSQIKTRYGIYATPGNHEYIADINRSLRFLKSAGIHLLRDTTVLVDDRFYLVGRDDKMNPNRKTVSQLMFGVNESKPVILLDHQPYTLEEAAQNGIDLQLSGHTHKGQVWPISWVTQFLFEKAHGYLKKENTHYYISSGIGIWGGKFRIGSQSEYVVIHLTPQS